MEDDPSPAEPGTPQPTLSPRTDDPLACAGRERLSDVLLGAAVGAFVYFLLIPVLAFVARTCVFERPSEITAVIITFSALGAAMAVAFGVAKWRRITRVQATGFARRMAIERAKCPVCTYSLVGLPEPRCPECGERFTAAEFDELR